MIEKKYKHILFDFDNTIWDFNQNSMESLHEVYILHKLETIFEDFTQFYTLYSYQNQLLWREYNNRQINKKTLNEGRFNYPLLQMGVQDSQLAHAIGNDYLRFTQSKSGLMPYAREVLDELKQKYQLHILSNGFSELQYKKIESSGLEKHFQKIILSEQVGVLKPDKRIFDYAITSLNAHRNQVLMVGDNFEADIVGAKKAGIDQVYYQLDEDAPLQQNFEPTYTISSLKELLNFL